MIKKNKLAQLKRIYGLCTEIKVAFTIFFRTNSSSLHLKQGITKPCLSMVGGTERRNSKIITAYAYVATGGYVLLNFPPREACSLVTWCSLI